MAGARKKRRKGVKPHNDVVTLASSDAARRADQRAGAITTPPCDTSAESLREVAHFRRVHQAFLRGCESYRLAVMHCDEANGGVGRDGQPMELVKDTPRDNPSGTLTRNIREHPLDLMYHKGQINERQFMAGERYRRDCELSEISPASASSYENIFLPMTAPQTRVEETEQGRKCAPCTFGPKRGKTTHRWKDLEPVNRDAMDRRIKAYQAVAAAQSEAHATVLNAVCVNRHTLGDVGKWGMYGHRNKVGKTFKAALDALDLHYGGGRGERRVGRISGVMAEGARPVVDGLAGEHDGEDAAQEVA